MRILNRRSSELKSTRSDIEDLSGPPTPSIATVAAVRGGRVRRFLGGVVSLPMLMLILLVVHKCVTDSLSQYTRTTGVPYSANTVAILGEIVKVPLLLVAIGTFEGWGRVIPVLKEATTDRPLDLCLPGLAYSAQNVLYFMALSYLSAASYQILSQSKLLFTAFFMTSMLGKRLGAKQYGALVLLMIGTMCTQLSEVSRAVLMGGSGASSGALYGGALTVAGAALSALPNVYYEKVLKTEGQNQWVKNVQLTFWIGLWLVVMGLPAMVRGLLENGAAAAGAGGGLVFGLSSFDGALTGVTPLVWAVTLLQGFKCLLIPATLKYADNILYAYTKPASIILTAAVTAMATSQLPSPQFLCGAAGVIASMWLYNQK